jgi:alpha-1,3-rhamnosyltransferase
MQPKIDSSNDKVTVEKPTVSIVIPSYNHRLYVEQAVESAVGQSGEGFRLEVLVVDDGSTDGSPELLSALSSRLGFRLVLKRNEGLCATLNRAVREHAKGDFIAIMASDDIMIQGKVSKQLSELRSNPRAGLVYARARSFTANGEGDVRPNILHRGIVTAPLTIYNFVPAGTVMYSRDVFDAIGGYDRDGMLLEDWDFMIRASRVTEFCAVDEVLLRYRIHDSGAMVKARRDRRLFSEKMKMFRKNRGMINPILYRLAVVAHWTLDVAVRGLLATIGDLRRRAGGT